MIDTALTFLTVLDTGSFSAAARQLGTSQSTVSRHVAELEQRAGRALFVRRGRRADPTDAARALEPSARQLDRSACGFARLVAGVSERAAGTVRITTAPELAAHLLAPALPTLLSRHPDLRVELCGDHAVADLTSGEADVALRVAAPIEADLVRRRVGELSYRLFGTRAALDAAPRRFLGYAGAYAALPEAQWTERRAGAGGVIARVAPPAAVVAACRAGAGVALLPEALAAPHTAQGRLFADGPVALVRPVFAIVHRDLARAPRVRAVIDWISATWPATAVT